MNGNFNDSGPNGYNLTATNGPTDATGKFNGAKNFATASSQYASIAHASCPNLEISGSQSWVCWINQTTITSYQCPMNMSASDGSARRGLVIDADAGNSISFELAGLTTNATVQSTEGAIVTGSFIHIAGVYNSSTLKVYIDGVENNSVSASGSPTDLTDGGFAIGARAGAAAFYQDGITDDAAVFSKALSVAEIASLVSAGPSYLGKYI